MPHWPSPNRSSPDLPGPATPDGADASAGRADRAGGAETALLLLARAAIASRLGAAYRDSDLHPPPTPWLDEAGACFVTLQTDGKLHGCIGSVDAHRPLREDVVHNARAAALRDRRFAPLTAEDLDHTVIEVSLLSPPTPLGCIDEGDALAQLRPGRDGVVLHVVRHDGEHRAVFLPQVWAKLPEPRDFLVQLKIKAGLPADFWSPSLTLRRFTVREVHEGSGCVS